MAVEEKTNIVKTAITRQQMGDAHLEIYTKTFNGNVVLEAFTLASLAEVLGMPMSTMEGRYARAKLHRLKVDIPMSSGRPARGFPLAMLEQVIQYVMTPGAQVVSTPNSDTMEMKLHRITGDLIPVYHDGKPYFTLAAMAEHFGVSATTIRNKLQKAGLMRRLVNLGSGMYGGRPVRAMPESGMADVRMAIEEGARFQTELDRILSSATRKETGRQYVADNVVQHTPPPRGSMRAWDGETLAPVVPMKPVNGVNYKRDTFDSDALAQELAAELDAIMAGAPKAVSGTVATVAAEPVQPAPEPDAAVIRRQAWEWQLNALSGVAEEPTDQDLRDTCEMMELDRAESERFIGEVKAARAGRA